MSHAVAIVGYGVDPTVNLPYWYVHLNDLSVLMPSYPSRMHSQEGEELMGHFLGYCASHPHIHSFISSFIHSFLAGEDGFFRILRNADEVCTVLYWHSLCIIYPPLFSAQCNIESIAHALTPVV